MQYSSIGRHALPLLPVLVVVAFSHMRVLGDTSEPQATDPPAPASRPNLDLDRSSIEPAYRNWSADKFFDDPKVLELCEAIKAMDFDRIEHLVKKEGVDINARGHDNVTPLFWMFPLGLLEAYKSIPRDENGYLIESEMGPAEQVAFAKHARLMERLIELGADPNVKLSDIRPESQRETQYEVPLVAFFMVKGLAVTHLAARLYGVAEYNYFPMVMANGGDPNLIYDARGVPPVFLVVGAYYPSYSPRGSSSPQNLALLIGARVDLEFRAPDGNTPILAAADAEHFDLVHMLMHAGADVRAKNQRGLDLAWFMRKRKRFIENMPAEYKKFFEEVPNYSRVEGTRREIEPYFLDVVGFLEEEALLPEGTQPKWKAEIDQLIKDYGKAAYGKRDPFVDEWVAKRRKLPEANKEVPTAKSVK